MWWLKTEGASSVTPQGITETPLGQTLLNGNNIAMVSRTTSSCASIFTSLQVEVGMRRFNAELTRGQLIPGGKGPKA